MDNLLGYIVLTLQRDGTWKDDWDGCVHSRRVDADRALDTASDAMGSEHALLVGLTPVGTSQSGRPKGGADG